MSTEGFVNTTTVVLTSLHTRNAVTEGTHFGRGLTLIALPLTAYCEMAHWKLLSARGMAIKWIFLLLTRCLAMGDIA